MVPYLVIVVQFPDVVYRMATPLFPAEAFTPLRFAPRSVYACRISPLRISFVSGLALAWRLLSSPPCLPCCRKIVGPAGPFPPPRFYCPGVPGTTGLSAILPPSANFPGYGYMAYPASVDFSTGVGRTSPVASRNFPAMPPLLPRRSLPTNGSHVGRCCLRPTTKRSAFG